MWKCSSCNSTEVEQLDWVDLNSGEPLGDGDDLGEFYCRGCESQVDVYYEEDDNDDDPLSTNTVNGEDGN